MVAAALGWMREGGGGRRRRRRGEEMGEDGESSSPDDDEKMTEVLIFAPLLGGHCGFCKQTISLHFENKTFLDHECPSSFQGFHDSRIPSMSSEADENF